MIVDTMKVLFKLLMGKWVPKGWFFEHGHTNGAIKLTMAGTQDWWRQFPPLLGC